MRRPAQCGAERVCRVGGGERDGGGLLRHGRVRAGVGAEGAEPVHGGRHGELCGAEVLDEIPAAAAPHLLEAGQHLVHEPETARDALTCNGAAGEDAVTVQ